MASAQHHSEIHVKEGCTHTGREVALMSCERKDGMSLKQLSTYRQNSELMG